MKRSPNFPSFSEKYINNLVYYIDERIAMKTDFVSENGKLSFEKASELGKTLSRGGIALTDTMTAFSKKCASK